LQIDFKKNYLFPKVHEKDYLRLKKKKSTAVEIKNYLYRVPTVYNFIPFLVAK